MTNLSNTWPRAGAAAVAAVIVLVDAGSAAACSCAGPEAPDIAMAGADVVFEGTPRSTVALEADIGLLDYRGAKRFDFEVDRYFKGQLGSSLSVFTINQGSACGREYSLDEPHIIYARYSDSGLLTDFACSRSHPSRFASDDAPVLGEGVAPDPTVVDEESDRGVTSGSDGSGIHRVPLEPDAGPRGCVSSLALPSPMPSGGFWGGVLAGMTLLLLRKRMRRER
jgi:hypothetical protein